MFWNCQGIRSKRKELKLYLKENSVHIITLNETFLHKKINFKIQGHDTIRNDRSAGSRGGVAFLLKHGLVVNKEFRNADFNIITENEALAINLELSRNQNLTLATIYCPDGNPNFPLFQTINNLSDNVMSEISTRNYNPLDAPAKTLLVLCLKLSKTNLTLFTSIMMNIRIWTEEQAALTY